MNKFRHWFIGRSDLGGYMHRWLLRTPWFALRVHRILTSDEGRDFHDHPFTFVSLILSGGYIEHRPGCHCSALLIDAWGAPAAAAPCRYYGPGFIIRRKATDLHRLELPNGKPAWTFVVTSRYFRMWGFQTAKGWVRFDEYPRSLYVKP